MIILRPALAVRANPYWDELATIANIRTALTYVLRTAAVDPDRIVLMGGTGRMGVASAISALAIAGDNLDVFSRVVMLTTFALPTGDVDPPPPTQPPEFLLYSSGPSPWTLYGGAAAAQELRRVGHRVKHVLRYQPPGPAQVHEYVGDWLRESWAIPEPAARPAARIIAAPHPLLTDEALAKISMFWKLFVHEPDSVRLAARQKYWREFVIQVGRDRSSLMMSDMPALAARYPSVATALHTAGLTAEQYDAYRVALVSAAATAKIGGQAGPFDPASALARNVELRYADLDRFDQFEEALQFEASLTAP